MANKLKISELKSHLNELNQKELINLITELQKYSKDAETYLSVKFLGEAAIQEQHKQAKKKILDEFFPQKGHGKLRLTNAKKAITNFKKLTQDLYLTTDLMIYYVEVGTEFTNTYGDIDLRFYNSLLSMYEKAIQECEKDRALYEHFKNRLSIIVHEASGIGWGYHEELEDLFYSIKYELEEEHEN